MTASPNTASPRFPRRPSSADGDAQHLAQMADHGEPPRGRVAVMDVALAGVRRAVLVGQVLADDPVGRRAQHKVAGEVAVQQRDDILARPQGHGHADRRGLVSRAAGHGAFDVALLKQLQQPLFQSAGEEHQGIGGPIERFAAQAMGRRPISASPASSAEGRSASLSGAVSVAPQGGRAVPR